MKEDNESKLDDVVNVKIMIHWEKRLILSVKLHTRSPGYKTLILLGYEEVGELKEATRRFYWDDKHFEIAHKLMV